MEVHKIFEYILASGAYQHLQYDEDTRNIELVAYPPCYMGRDELEELYKLGSYLYTFPDFMSVLYRKRKFRPLFSPEELKND